jgi:hypothetical protein
MCLALLDDLEILGRQVAHMTAAVVDDHRVDDGEVGAGAENLSVGRLLR